MEVPHKLSEKVANDLDRFVADGNEVVSFKLLRTAEDLKNPKGTFRPEMCHQVFNEQETIFGYENLKIKLHFTAGSLKTYVGIDYTSKISKSQCDGIEPDNIREKLEKILAPGYTTNLDDFTASIPTETESFRPAGELINSFTVLSTPVQKESKQKNSSNNITRNNSTSPNGMDIEPEEKTYVIYYVDCTDPKFTAYLGRMETFLLWFVDAASFIDTDDEKWKIFTMFEKYKTSEGNTAYAFIGYSSVYNFFAYPENIRPRIAQMLILPPFQRRGLGVHLMSAIYKQYRNDPKVTEITVEDPSDDFEMLRDYVDARDCMKLSSYSPQNLKKGFSQEMTEEAARVLKMTKRQARRMYEVLRLKITNVNDEKELKEYRVDVKRRLNIPYQKQESDIKRMMRRKCNSTQLQQAAAIDDASRKTELESNFKNLYTHYQNILNRLDRYAV